MAREKRVFNDYNDVARLWANQSQQYAEYTGSKMYFSGDTIYSYGAHFPIAKFVTNNSGDKAILFTLATWSNTTSNHVNVVKGAAQRTGEKIVYCPDLTKNNDQRISYWLSEIDELVAQIRKKSNRKFEGRLADLKRNAKQLRDYMNFFEITPSFEMETILSFAEAGDVVNQLRNSK